MSQQTISVQPNIITTVNVSLPAGATIHNTDSNNAVWVGNNPGVGPNAGMRIGPKGSLTWSAGKTPCYAALDSGGTDTVSLSVSTDVTNLTNPVDIGIAVATQLVNQGIPSVFLGDDLGSGTAMPNIGGFTYGLLGLDVSRYASVVVTMFAPFPMQILTEFASVGGSELLGKFSCPVTSTSDVLTFVLPVTGPSLSILAYATAACDVNYSVYGSNRPCDQTRVLTQYGQAWNGVHAGAKTFPDIYDIGPAFISNGKPVFAHLVVTGGFTGFIGYKSFNTAGIVVNQSLLDSTLGEVGISGDTTSQTIILPPGKLQIYFQAGTSGTYTVALNLIQEF